MRLRNLAAGVTAGLLFMLPLRAAEERAQATPQRPHSMVVVADYGPAPVSFDDLWSLANVVVRGQVQGTIVRKSSHAHGAVPVTQHQLRILEVLKGGRQGLKVGQAVPLIQMAGALDIDGTQVTADPGSMPVLAPGQEILAFLAHNPHENAFAIASGPAGLYVLDDELVTIPREAKALASFCRETV